MFSSTKLFCAAIVIPLALASLLTVAGCRSIATTVARDLRLNLGIEPATIDPALATDPGSQQIARMIFLSLVDLDPETGEPQHALATSWAVSADGLIWEFKLRDDAQWVHYIPVAEQFEIMRPVKAADVVYSVRRVFDPRVGSGFAPYFSSLVRGAEQLRSADPKQTSSGIYEQLFNNLGVQAPDDTTVRFILTRPAADFPTLASTWLVRLQPREAVEKGGSVWTDPGNLWTNGPYALERWGHGREMILRKNPYWYDASTVRIERVQFTMNADRETALDEFKHGELDSLDPYGKLTPSDVEGLKDDTVLSKQLHLVPSLCTHYYGFNTAKAPFDDVLVRKAFAAAVDRDTLASSVVKLGEPARWFTRAGVFASFDISDTLGIPFDANQARDYMKQAGYDRRRLGAITLGVNTDDMNELIAETIVQMWKNNLGVEVNVKRMDWKSYQQILKDDAPQIYRLGWCAYIPDAANFTESVFRSGSQDNYTRWSSTRLDQLVDGAARDTDIAKRRSAYRSVEKLLVEENAVIIPLWWSTRASLTRSNIQRSYAITDGYERLEQWSIQ